MRDDQLTMGALFAFGAYQELVAAHLKGIVGQLSAYAAARTQLEMIDDLMAAETEQYLEGTLIQPSPAGLELVLRKVSYTFSASDPLILRELDLEVRAGECVAIVGPSGSGKSTLLRILMGLSRPTQGTFRVDSVDPWTGDIRQYRRLIAAVMQDDQLLSGTIRDNIAGGDAEPDRERIQSAAERACLRDDILQMPAGFKTRVGEMGNALSAGQKQRILLARALYRNPTVLLLDEATGNLDLEAERKIVTALGGMRITRVVVTHRPEILRIADRIYELRDGRLILLDTSILRQSDLSVTSGP
jgi:ATP-binding cassette subfamily B protein RaxB